MRFTTLKEIDRAGLDVRLWCYGCCRGVTVDGIIWSRFQDRGLSLQLSEARRHFPCRRCGARDCLIIPARATGPRPKDNVGMGVTWFFHNRSIGKGRSGKRVRPNEFGLAGALPPARMLWRTIPLTAPRRPSLRLASPTGSRLRRSNHAPQSGPSGSG